MILDVIGNWRECVGVDSRLWPGFLFISEQFQPSMKDGRYEFAGGTGYANVESYRTGPAAERKFEAHRKHIDIQYILAGEEMIQWAPITDLGVVTPYSEEKDAGFWESRSPVTQLVLTAGRFAVFFPSDAHKPGCHLSGPAAVRKIVAKIRL